MPSKRSSAALVLPLGLAVVEGESMRPALLPGDRVVVRYGSAGVRPGRLVLVRLGGVTAVKRAGVRDADGWWVESDNPGAPGAVDSWKAGRPVPPEDVVGVVVARLPRRGRRGSAGS